MWIEPSKGKREAQKKYEAKIKQLELENQLLRDTLSYYADVTNWHSENYVTQNIHNCYGYEDGWKDAQDCFSKINMLKG